MQTIVPHGTDNLLPAARPLLELLCNRVGVRLRFPDARSSWSGSSRASVGVLDDDESVAVHDRSVIAGTQLGG